MKISKLITKYDFPTIELTVKIFQYDRGREQLQSSVFFIQEIQKALDKEDWPLDDKADGNLPISSLTGDTAKQKQMKGTQLQKTRNQWESSRELPRNLKRSASPTPEPSDSKRRRTAASKPML